MSLVNFLRRDRSPSNWSSSLDTSIFDGYSLEIIPRAVDNLTAIKQVLPLTSRLYIAQPDGTPFASVLNAAKCFRAEGYAVMPHLPARAIRNVADLEAMLAAYRREANVDQALVVAGSRDIPIGDFSNSMDLLETGLFAKYDFRRLHVAGHPEGNLASEPAGTHKVSDNALLWKQGFASRTGCEMAIVTQFAFDARVIINWGERLANLGITMPIHVGIAGPTKMTTLLKYAILCGVGPSIEVLKKRAVDLTKLMLPYEPGEMLSEIADHRSRNPKTLIRQLHFFPFGGVNRTAEWVKNAATKNV